MATLLNSYAASKYEIIVMIVFLIITIIDCTLCLVLLYKLKSCYLLSDVPGSLGPTNTADSELGFHAFFSMCPENLLVILLPCCYLLLLVLLQYLLSIKSCSTAEKYCYNLHCVLLSCSIAHCFDPCKSKDLPITQQNLNINFFCHFATNMHYEVPQNFTTF